MKISFIGGGNMATALIAGLVGRLAAGPDIQVVDPNSEALHRLNGQYGVNTAETIGARVGESEVVVLAVKPQQMREVAAALRPQLAQSRPLVLSIAAGIRGADLSRWLGDYGAIVRCMPNTPALVGMGVTGMVAMPGVSEQQKAAADSILRAVGKTVWLSDESLIDPVTGVSGSGPAYVFYFMEAMQQAALELGLSAEQGKELALETFRGAAQLAAQSSEPVEVLRERVTSKGGTTYAAITSMEQAGVKQAIVEAVKAAAARGRELGEQMGRDA
ncbi:pyrroline-5-carboxylate reductase [Massilia solisilvae]|uniref:Pyrroline-5-carboxylate reductase n=1 Tax=Massilia solisilvae TaxID=1811225 RepID=A0ABT2BPX4_9BURK|nr:pyrroline-5-carboxylate reductase [Massilia solisilvae]MCS0610544.1 pyrroline-5-carboxylate reductase [Massilia solisilvae]